MSLPKKNPTIVIFGVTGNLYKIKLAEALAKLFKKGSLGRDFKVIGFGRRNISDREFRGLTKDSLQKSLPKAKLNKFLSHFSYIQGDLNKTADFKKLNVSVKNSNSRLLYLAVPPELHGTALKNISKAKLDKGARILIEKPFGRNLKEAKKLDSLTKKLFKQDQIFHVDHYLAKQPMQKLLAMHLKNKSLSTSKKIKRVRILFHEKISVGKRETFDKVGALRDVGQNHMLQILALIAMKNLKSKSAREIHKARKMILEKIKVYPDKEIVRGQYKGYLLERGVKKSSKTETFFRATLTVSNKNWRGIPFEIEGGKALARSEISFKIYFGGLTKPKTFLISSDKNQYYDPYEKVFHDCLLGDHTLFVSSGEIMSQWRITEKIMKQWRNTPLIIYNKGSKGEHIK